ncbi:MAG TPA: glycosyltransferase [Methanothrix sp.]|nr:glycosyltransferase [Methanothrix sp.]HOK58496.1 glycosyltransferase [Methanothrix sp.]HOL44009.1 glycosyltransferase [Methanothrix sp.]HPO88767.1 glycosyltransferase [Methanothrix sp.]
MHLKMLFLLCFIIDSSLALQAPGFSIVIGNANIQGNENSGVLTSEAHCLRFNLFWLRDLGVGPESYLDAIQELYAGNGLVVESKSRFSSHIRDINVSFLDVNYSFAGCSTRKTFAVWYSNATDRTYIASMDSCSDDREVLLSILRTISETNRSRTLVKRKSCNDTWSLLLSDLLSSWRYAEPSHLTGGQFLIHTNHMVSERGLLSYDGIDVSSPQDLFMRPAAVFYLLRGAGYTPVIMQRHGSIWIAVKDDDEWQAISLNPLNPDRAVGVQVFEDECYTGIVYSDPEELAAANTINLTVPVGYIVRRCEPSRYVQLEMDNSTDRGDLERVLEEHTYRQRYSKDRFDCSNASQVCWSFLKGMGYDAYLMVGAKDHPLGEHMWVVVRRGHGYIAIESAVVESSQNFVNLGSIRSDGDYYRGVMYNSSVHYSLLNPEEGMWLEPGDERIWSRMSRKPSNEPGTPG